MGTKLSFHDLQGPPRPSPRTPWGSMDPRLRTYALEISSNVPSLCNEIDNRWWEWNYKANSVGLSSDSIVYMKIFPDDRNNSYYVISFDEAILGWFNHFHND